MAYNPDLLVDGYISRSFGPKDAEVYLCNLLKTDQPGLKDSWLTLQTPNGSGVRFVARAAADTFHATPLMQDSNGHPSWLIDYSIASIGTVVPQSLWSPQSYNHARQYVADAPLQLPIFFILEDSDGILGISLHDAANGRCQTLRDARTRAPLGGKSTTHIRILWPGYNGFRRQIQIRDETPSRNPITIAKFAHHIGRSVEAFLQNKTPNTTRSLGDDRWIIGQNGINCSKIRVIGAIHVSAGSWMPILQLSDVWVF